MTRWELWLLGWALAAVLLVGLYLVQRRTRDATAVDAGWGGAIVAVRGALRAARAGHARAAAADRDPRRAREPPDRARSCASRLGKGEDSRYRELRRALARARPRAAELRGLLPGAGVPGRAALGAGAARVVQQGTSIAPVQWVGARALGRRRRRSRRLADRQLAAFKADPANTGGVMRSGSLALLAPPELLLPDADLGRLRADRRRGALGLDRLLRPALHPLPRPLRHGRAAGGGVVAALARRRLPPLPARDGRLRPMVPEALVDRLIESGRVPDPLLRAGVRAACATRLRRERRRGPEREARVRRAAARLADRRAGREGERAALRGAAGVLPARARAAAQVQLVPLGAGRAHARPRRRRRCSR